MSSTGYASCRSRRAPHASWNELDPDVLRIVLEKVSECPGQLAQCRLVCRVWGDIVATCAQPRTSIVRCAQPYPQISMYPKHTSRIGKLPVISVLAPPLQSSGLSTSQSSRAMHDPRLELIGVHQMRPGDSTAAHINTIPNFQSYYTCAGNACTAGCFEI
jgi:hypothetical protein